MKRFVVTLFFVAAGLFYLFQEPDYTPTAVIGTSVVTFPRAVVTHPLPSFPGHMADHAYIGQVIDICISTDGVLFVPRGTIEGGWRNKSWAEIRKLSPQAMMLDEFCRSVGTKRVMFWRVRRIRGRAQFAAEHIAHFIYSRGLQDTVVVSSVNPFFLIFMRWYARDTILAYCMRRNENSDSFYHYMLNFPFVQKQVRRVVRPDILCVHSFEDAEPFLLYGYPVVVWDVYAPETLQKLWHYPCAIAHLGHRHLLDRVLLGRQLYDAGGAVADVSRIVRVTSAADVRSALQYARTHGKKVALGGSRHSMDGHTIADDALYLDMTGLTGIREDKANGTVIVQAGVTWKRLQRYLDKKRAVHVMQSDNVFTIGGSVSVNAHGWQSGEPPLVTDVQSLKIILADGSERTLSRRQNRELFSAVIGGYGAFGVITEVEIKVVRNAQMRFHAAFVHLNDFLDAFDKYITENPNAELAYARVNTDSNNAFKDVGLFWYENVQSDELVEGIEPARFVALKRAVLRSAMGSDMGKKLRWKAEKAYMHLLENISVSRNTAMTDDVHVIPALQGMQNTLQEYFVPKERIEPFLSALRRHIEKFGINLVNLTIREVRADRETLLSYAPKDMFSCVLLITYHKNAGDEQLLKDFTQDMVSALINLGGTFYLPYRAHYTCEQLHTMYPHLSKWWELKQKVDPTGMFSSQFLQKIGKCVNEKSAR